MTILPFLWSLLCITMPCLPNNLNGLRLTVASVLKKHSGELYTANDLVDTISIAADLDGNENIYGNGTLSTNLLLKAFAFDGEKEYHLVYDGLKRDNKSVFPNDTHVLYVRLPLRSGDTAVFGRFDSFEDGQDATDVRFNADLLDADIKQNLITCLELESKPKPSKKKKKSVGETGTTKKQRTQPSLGEQKKDCQAEIEEAEAALEKARAKMTELRLVEVNNQLAAQSSSQPSSQPRAETNGGGEEDADEEDEEDEEGNDAATGPITSSPVEGDRPTQVIYTFGGRAGMLDIDPDSELGKVIEENLHPLSYEDTDSARRRRLNKTYTLNDYGAVEYWTPAGITGYSNNNLSRLRKDAGIWRRMRARFDGLKSTFSWSFMRRLTEGGLHNMGGSDEGMEGIVNGTFLGLRDDLDLPLTDRQIALATPSRRSIARSEHRLAAECLVYTVEQIKKDNATWVALLVDHGKRNGKDHFVKIIVWAGKDEYGNRVLKHFCLDIDTSGHSSKDCADAIKDSIEKLRLAGLDTDKVTIVAITSDSGGGGAVQYIHPYLKMNGVMTALSRMLNCQFHALNKCFEIACTKTFGQTGLDKNNIFQATFVYCKMIKALKTFGGLEMVDEVHSTAVEKLLTCEIWQSELVKSNKIAFDGIWEMIFANMDEGGNNWVEALEVICAYHERNIKTMNFQRWMTVLPAIKLFIDNWAINYSIALAIHQAGWNNIVTRYADSLLAAMNTASGKPGTANENAAHCPPLYAQGLLVRGYGEAYFEKHFDWLLCSDPEFGPDSWGQTTRLYLIRIYMMNKGLEDLMELEKAGELRSHESFAAYYDAVDAIPDLQDKTLVDKNYFLEAPGLFFKLYGEMFQKHVIDTLVTEEIMIYMVGAQPELAKVLLEWIFFAKNDEGDISSYEFPDRMLQLTHQGSSSDESTTINIRDAMTFLTTVVDEEGVKTRLDAFKMGEDPIIQMNEKLWEEYAASGPEVDLFKKSTWPDGADFEQLLDIVHGMIAIHPLHQQLCENHVQDSQRVGATNVDQDRCTWRENIVSAIQRTFSKKAKVEVEKSRAEEKKRAEENGEEYTKKTTIARVEGSVRWEKFGPHCTDFHEVADEAIEKMGGHGGEQFVALLNHIKGDENKTSRKDADAAKRKLAEGVNKPRKITKAEQSKVGADVTAEMGGKIKVGQLQKKDDEEMKAEVDAREIELPKDWGEMGIKERRDALRRDELKNLALEEKVREGAVVKDIKEIVPMSEEMKAIMAEVNSRGKKKSK